MIFNVMKFGKSQKIELPIPTVTGTLTYNGSVQEPVFNNYVSGYMEISGDTKATNAGEYTATFHILDTKNYTWEGGSTTDKTVKWTIERATVSTVPSQSGTLTYTGNYLYPSWSNYNTAQLSLDGTTTSINAGTYYAHFTPTSNYQWSDGSITYKNVPWTINKAAGSVTLNPATLNLTEDSPTGTSTITILGDGKVTNTGTGSSTGLSWTITQNSITATATDSATETITISVSAGTNHLSTSATLTIKAVLGSALDTMPWSMVSSFSSNGTLSNYAAIGDTKSMEITVPFQSNAVYKVKAFIIGFNHNSSLEGNNLTHFQLCKIGETYCALTDSYYGSANDSYGSLHMKSKLVSSGSTTSYESSNEGGWLSSDLRSYLGGGLLPSSTSISSTALKMIPSELRNAMRAATKYTDNVGGNSSGGSASVTSSTEYFTLLSEYEIYGSIQYGNSYESSKQTQYEFYKSGNTPTVFYRNNKTSSGCTMWLRSPAFPTSSSLQGKCFMMFMNSETRSYRDSRYSYAISPIFFV